MEKSNPNSKFITSHKHFFIALIVIILIFAILIPALLLLNQNLPKSTNQNSSNLNTITTSIPEFKSDIYINADNTVYAVDSSTGISKKVFNRNGVISNDGQFIAIKDSANNKIGIYTVNDNKPVNSIDLELIDKSFPDNLVAESFSPDNKYILVKSLKNQSRGGESLYLYDLVKNKTVRNLGGNIARGWIDNNRFVTTRPLNYDSEICSKTGKSCTVNNISELSVFNISENNIKTFFQNEKQFLTVLVLDSKIYSEVGNSTDETTGNVFYQSDVENVKTQEINETEFPLYNLRKNLSKDIPYLNNISYSSINNHNVYGKNNIFYLTQLDGHNIKIYTYNKDDINTSFTKLSTLAYLENNKFVAENNAYTLTIPDSWQISIGENTYNYGQAVLSPAELNIQNIKNYHNNNNPLAFSFITLLSGNNTYADWIKTLINVNYSDYSVTKTTINGYETTILDNANVKSSSNYDRVYFVHYDNKIVNFYMRYKETFVDSNTNKSTVRDYSQYLNDYNGIVNSIKF